MKTLTVVHDADAAPKPDAVVTLVSDRLGDQAAPTRLADRRKAAAVAFDRAGWPTRREEAWKYTDLKRLSRWPLRPAPAAGDADVSADHLVKAAVDADRLVLVNGRLAGPAPTLGDGVTVRRLSEMLAVGEDVPVEFDGGVGRSAPVDINVALADDAVVLTVADGATVERPIHLVHVSAPGDGALAAYPRLVIQVGAAATVTLLESSVGPNQADCLVSAVTDLEVADAARVNHYRLQSDGTGAATIANLRLTVGRDATYDGFTLTLGGGLTRNEAQIELTGPGADFRLSGAYLGDGNSHIDTTTLLRHGAPDCRSRQVFKGVLDGRARGVFQGRIMVDQIAQRTDGHQLSNALLLSPRAEMDAKPELEIFADDVRCSHGATTGQIDEDALFYLRARGIDAKVARGLLIDAFVAEAIAEIDDAGLREVFAEIARIWWHARHGDDGSSEETGS